MLVADHRVLHVLLRDRRAAARAAGDLLEGRVDDAGQVEAGVGVERPVLGREHRVLHRQRDLGDRHLLPVALLPRGDAGEDAAVGERDGVELALHRGVRVGHRDEQPPEREAQQRDADRGGEQRVARPAAPAPQPRRGRERRDVLAVEVGLDVVVDPVAGRDEALAAGPVADLRGDGEDEGRDRRGDAPPRRRRPGLGGPVRAPTGGGPGGGVAGGAGPGPAGPGAGARGAGQALAPGGAAFRAGERRLRDAGGAPARGCRTAGRRGAGGGGRA